eukprot:CAMPEP_0172498756 /NCGR_PEP_ID=MMETSP1066-20121228/116977_1 /TAXON_ID=671091 /ORGANISM="Coscinodiscus wailesii, Strain CCMP2513" /LENGTH=356 /DNA_ID=CAMNT_0013272169 /DNA_START=216 /DNA_END=1286 /DNA_ORIENTATION=-
MGGASAPKYDKRLDLSKNNKIRAIALDFDLITRSLNSAKGSSSSPFDGEVGATDNTLGTNGNAPLAPAQPDVGTVEQMASLLNVKLGGGIEDKSMYRDVDDDLSGIMGMGRHQVKSNIESAPSPTPIKTTSTPDKNKKLTANTPLGYDVRSKYASKLRDKLEGGLSGIERAKYEKEQQWQKGDAGMGHLEARKMVLKQGSSSSRSGSKWMASTGTGALLNYLTSRSTKIALLPTPVSENDYNDGEETWRRMEDLKNQLPQVKFGLLVKGGKERTVNDIVDLVLKEFDVPPINAIMVSDRDDYLKVARDKGLYTCRVRPPNTRRGEITAHYNVETVSEIQDVLNELNGISYATVFGG